MEKQKKLPEPIIEFNLINDPSTPRTSQSAVFATARSDKVSSNSSLNVSPEDNIRQTSSLKIDDQSKLFRIHMFKIASRESTPSNMNSQTIP